MSDPFAVSLGPYSLTLPAGWEPEIDLIHRAPDQDGYRPNLRLSLRSGGLPAALGALADAYQVRLARTFEGNVERLERRERSFISEAPGIELTFRIDLGQGRIADHHALIVCWRGLTLTVATSARTSDSREIYAELEQALNSLCSPAR